MYVLTVKPENKIYNINFYHIDRHIDTDKFDEQYIISSIDPNCYKDMLALAHQKSFNTELSTSKMAWRLLHCYFKNYNYLTNPSTAILSIGMIDD